MSGRGIWPWLLIVVALVATLNYGIRKLMNSQPIPSELSVDGLFLGRSREELKSFGWQENTGAWDEVWVNGVQLWRRESPRLSIGWRKERRSCSITGSVLSVDRRLLLSRGDKVDDFKGLAEQLQWNEVGRDASTIEWKTPDETYVAVSFPDGSTCDFVSISESSHPWTSWTARTPK